MRALLLAALLFLAPALAFAQSGGGTGGGGGGGGCTSNCTITGSLTTTNQITSGNIVSPSAPQTAGQGWWYNTNSITGTMTGNNRFSAGYWGVNDSLNTNSNSGNNVNSLMEFNVNWATGFTGNRNLMFRFCNATGSPGAGDTTAHAYVCDLVNAQASANMGGISTTAAGALGSFWSGNDNTYAINGATNIADLWGREIDCGAATGSSVYRIMCAGSIIDALSAVQPSMTFTAYVFAAKPGATALYKTGLGIGGEVATWAFDNTSCLICVIRRLVPTPAAQPTADRGLDLRDLSTTTGPVMTNNAGFDNNGVANGANLQTALGLTAQNGTITAINIVAGHGVAGGAYFNTSTLPTIAIAAPPNGGVTALAAPTHMQLTDPILLAAGTGYAVNDVLTVTGGTGTNPTITVNTVGGGGQILTYSITTQGDYTVTPPSSTFTGGTGTSASFDFGFGIKTISISNAGTLYPAFPPPPVLVTPGASNSEQLPAVLTATVTPAIVPLNFNSPLKMNIASTYSANTWATAGVAMTGSATTYNDATSSGTTAVEAMFNPFGSPTITASGASTYTDLVTLFVPLTTASTNVTASTRWAIETAGGIKITAGQGLVTTVGATISGGISSINNNSNFSTSINTGTSTGTISIGNAGNTGLTSLLGISTGTNADFLCLSAAGVVLLQTSACTISSARFKDHISAFADVDALADVVALRPVHFQLKPTGNRDPNAAALQIGLIAEDVARTDKPCAIYENDMKTPKSYRQECVIAELVGAVKAQQAEIVALRAQLHHRRRH